MGGDYRRSDCMDQRRCCNKRPTCSCQQVVAVKEDDRGDGVLGLKGAILASAALGSLECSNIFVRVLQCTCQVCANARKPPKDRPLLLLLVANARQSRIYTD